MKSLVGCCFQRTKKPNTHKITPRRKAYLTLSERFFFLSNLGAIAIAPYVKSLSARLFFLPIFICGALKTAPYRAFINQEYYNLTDFSHKLFFNVKVRKNLKLTPLVSQIDI